MKVSILIPNMGRTEMFIEMLESLHRTTNYINGVEIETVIVMDVYSRAAIYATNYNVIIDYSLTKRGALWAWNRALQLSSGEYIVPAGDDQIFHDGWIETALSSHERMLRGYGVLGMNDLAYNGNTQVATMFLFDRKYCKDHMGGVFAPPMYHYYNIDSEWNQKAKDLGRFYWEEKSVVEHLHSAHNKRPIDDLDREKMDAGWIEIDNKTFEERKAQGFPITWQPII
jgi:glycosyltransferase involved in cell wall biosynthesis